MIFKTSKWLKLTEERLRCRRAVEVALQWPDPSPHMISNHAQTIQKNWVDNWISIRNKPHSFKNQRRYKILITSSMHCFPTPMVESSGLHRRSKKLAWKIGKAKYPAKRHCSSSGQIDKYALTHTHKFVDTQSTTYHKKNTKTRDKSFFWWLPLPIAKKTFKYTRELPSLAGRMKQLERKKRVPWIV